MSDLVVNFVCWGNICRSPMAERVARAWAEREGLDGVRFVSSAVSTEELGEPMDPRAAATLRRHGYDADGHVAHQIDADEITAADLVVAMEDVHVQRMERMLARADRGPGGADRIRLLTSFDPAAKQGEGVPDPWYGSAEGFEGTLAAVEAAMPGVLDEARRRLDRRTTSEA